MDKEKLYQIYDLMSKIRLTEEAVIEEYPSREIRTPVHLAIGQEGIAAGISISLAKKDFVVSNHRSHAHSLAKGLALGPFFRELYGKQGGSSGGWGGSMHLCDDDQGVVGTSAIVGGGIPIGVGYGLSQKLNAEGGVTVIYFGDGAVDEGVFWESLNFAALKKLPILFAQEDNMYASQTAKKFRHAYSDILPIVRGFGIAAEEVDGNDAVAVAEATARLLSDIRLGNGPAFLVCKTYRWMGHVGIEDDSHTGYRTVEELELWKKKCPLLKMESVLEVIDPEYAHLHITDIKEKWLAEIADAIREAKEADYALD